MDNEVRLEVLDDGTVVNECSLGEFLEANDGLDEETAEAVRALPVGGYLEEAGGGWAPWAVRRIQ